MNTESIERQSDPTRCQIRKMIFFLERQGFEKIDRSQPTKVIIQNGYIVLFLIIQGVKRYKTIGIDVASTKS